MKTNQLLNTSSFAESIDCSPYTLRLSRTTGLLFGKPAPEFIKIGKSCFYRQETIEQWIVENGVVCRNTAEAFEAQ